MVRGQDRADVTAGLEHKLFLQHPKCVCKYHFYQLKDSQESLCSQPKAASSKFADTLQHRHCRFVCLSLVCACLLFN